MQKSQRDRQRTIPGGETHLQLSDCRRRRPRCAITTVTSNVCTWRKWIAIASTVLLFPKHTHSFMFDTWQLPVIRLLFFEFRMKTRQTFAVVVCSYDKIFMLVICNWEESVCCCLIYCFSMRADCVCVCADSSWLPDALDNSRSFFFMGA